MPVFSKSLERSLHRALALANEGHHEYAALEHLLLALMDDDPDAAAVIRACNVDREKLRVNLVTYIESELEKFTTDGSKELQADGRLPTCNPTRGDPCAIVRTRGDHRR